MDVKVKTSRVQSADAQRMTNRSQQPSPPTGGSDYPFGDELLDGTLEKDLESYRSSNSLHDYLINVGDAKQSDVERALSNYPPRLTDLISERPELQNQADVLVKRYETTIKQLKTAQRAYQEILRERGTRVGDAEGIRKRLSLIADALILAEQEKLVAEELMGSMGKIWNDEWMHGVDLNGDDIIGDPNSERAVGIIEKDGVTALFDLQTGEIKAYPPAKPTYQAALFHGKGVKVIADADADKKSYRYTDDGSEFQQKPPDLFVQIDADRAKQNSSYDVSYGAYGRNGGSFPSPVQFGVPEAVWVNNETGRIYAEWETSNGIVQKIPEDKSKYTLTKITKLQVESEEAGYKANPNPSANDPGDPLYHHIFRLYDKDGNEVAVIRLEGATLAAGAANGHPSAVDIGGNKVAFAASNFAPLITGEADANGLGGRWSQVEIETDIESTNRTILGTEFARFTGIDPSVDPRTGVGHTAYKQLTSLFADEDITDHRYFVDANGKYIRAQGGGEIPDTGEPESRVSAQDVNGQNYYGITYGNFRSAYISDTNEPPPESTLLTIKTGAIFLGLSGAISGTAYNDLFIGLDADREFSGEIEEQFSSKRRKPKSGDKEYMTMFDGGAGHNVVVAGKGDFFGKGVGFYKGRHANRDKVILSMQDGFFKNKGEGNIWKNPKHFVDVSGAGTVDIENPVEEVTTETTGKKQKFVDTLLNDDYYSVERNKKVRFGDPDAIEITDNRYKLNRFQDLFIQDMTELFGTQIEEAILALPDIKLTDDEVVDFRRRVGADAENAEEMNSFFDEMFGWQGELFGDFDWE